MKNFVVTMTPMRISFVGGGTDFKEFYKQNNGGAVISGAINKYVYIIVNKYHDPGDYITKFSAQNIPSGIYFVALKNIDGIQTQKIILTK